MIRRQSLAEIRARTAKPVDAWWTVLLVDPVAVRLVRLVAPYRWITATRLTACALMLGLGAAACFARPGHAGLIAGALLFHLAFVADCVAGKLARLTGTGSLFGAWLAVMAGRLRAVVCAVALFGGQYARTGDPVFLWAATGVVGLDLLRYLNSSQMGRVRAAIQRERPGGPVAPRTARRRWLRSRRVGTYLVSGVEFEMAVFVAGPLTGWVIGVPVVAGVLLTGFEVRLVCLLWLSARRHARWMAAVTAEGQMRRFTANVA
jgi:phosphatidylglycerophosphate synthase